MLTKVDKCLNAAAIAYRTTPNRITSKSRKRHLVHARMNITEVLRMHGMTLQRIGGILGGRDHSSIVHYTQQHESLIKTSEEYKTDTAAFYEALNKTGLVGITPYSYAGTMAVGGFDRAKYLTWLYDSQKRTAQMRTKLLSLLYAKTKSNNGKGSASVSEAGTRPQHEPSRA